MGFVKEKTVETIVERRVFFSFCTIVSLFSHSHTSDWRKSHVKTTHFFFPLFSFARICFATIVCCGRLWGTIPNKTNLWCASVAVIASNRLHTSSVLLGTSVVTSLYSHDWVFGLESLREHPDHNFCPSHTYGKDERLEEKKVFSLFFFSLAIHEAKWCG